MAIVLPLVNAGEYFVGIVLLLVNDEEYFVYYCHAIRECKRIFCWL